MPVIQILSEPANHLISTLRRQRPFDGPNEEFRGELELDVEGSSDLLCKARSAWTAERAERADQAGQSFCDAHYHCSWHPRVVSRYLEKMIRFF